MGKYRLTEVQVEDIRSSTEPLKVLAHRHGCSLAYISRIRLGYARKIKPPKSPKTDKRLKYSDDIIAAVREAEGSREEIAERFGMSSSYVYALRAGENRKDGYDESRRRPQGVAGRPKRQDSSPAGQARREYGESRPPK